MIRALIRYLFDIQPPTQHVQGIHFAPGSQQMVPSFHPIQMTQAHFDDCIIMTQQVVSQVIQEISCSVTNLIMREPVRMKCCWELEKQFVDKYVAKQNFQNCKRCVKCQKSLGGSFEDNYKMDNVKLSHIFGFRCALAKTYKLANQMQKEKWGNFADVHFGENFSQKHLKTFKISN